jgi:hypothetical protein
MRWHVEIWHCDVRHVCIWHRDALTCWDSALWCSARLHSALWDSTPSRRAEFFSRFTYLHLRQPWNVSFRYRGDQFRKTGDCLVWPVVLKKKQHRNSSHFGPLFPQFRLCINFDQKRVWATFWAIFNKLIWSPCSGPTEARYFSRVAYPPAFNYIDSARRPQIHIYY